MLVILVCRRLVFKTWTAVNASMDVRQVGRRVLFLLFLIVKFLFRCWDQASVYPIDLLCATSSHRNEHK